MGPIVELDVRELPPPEPFISIMQALRSLPDGDNLQVHIHREPYPLYEALREEGYEWTTSPLADGSFLILISRSA